MTNATKIRGRGTMAHRTSAVLLVGTALALLGAGAARGDLCGCTGDPASLGAFLSSDAATHPPGTVDAGATITLPLPTDGVLVFDSFMVDGRTAGGNVTVRFQRNARNTPVTLLVAGDVTIAANQTLSVAGEAGMLGQAGAVAQGGLGGPGGFRGGDGAYQLVNFATDGGTGLGPGGAVGGTETSNTAGGDGTFAGIPELLPMIGGCGGGGGPSLGTASNCVGGGGGGGGGAILAAANGRIEVNGTINADGGAFGSWLYCANRGGRGSGGAIRLVANEIAGTGAIRAWGGGNAASNGGAIRLEAFTITFSPTSATPAGIATLAPAPGPIVNPLTPTVAITAVTDSTGGGGLVPDPPQGGYGAVDITIPAPGTVFIDLESRDVPEGTAVDVTIKPRVSGPTTGGPIVQQSATLDGCAAGVCVATATAALPAGTFTIEARATFQTP